MCFVISFLMLIVIVLVIGMVMKQNELMFNYVNQFGLFWFEIFGKVGLYVVYLVWWFLLIMGFLVLLILLCIVCNVFKMLCDVKSWCDNVCEQLLCNFYYKYEWMIIEVLVEVVVWLQCQVGVCGYKIRLVDKEGGMLLVVKQGVVNKWGYIFVYVVIVIICLGGLFDLDLLICFQ